MTMGGADAWFFFGGGKAKPKPKPKPKPVHITVHHHHHNGGNGGSAVTVTGRYVIEGIGCFKDEPSRAITGAIAVFDAATVIQKCAAKAKNEGNVIFGVQNNVECFTDSIAREANAAQTYAKYGATSGCKNGRGGTWRMNVYKLRGGHYGNNHGYHNGQSNGRWKITNQYKLLLVHGHLGLVGRGSFGWSVGTRSCSYGSYRFSVGRFIRIDCNLCQCINGGFACTRKTCRAYNGQIHNINIGIGGVLRPIGRVAGGIVVGLGHLVGGAAVTTGHVAGSLLTHIGHGAGAILAGTGIGIGQIAAGTGQGAHNILVGAGHGVGHVAVGVGEGVGKTVEGAGHGVGKVIEGVATGAGKIVGGVAKGALNIVGGVGKGVIGFFKGLGDEEKDRLLMKLLDEGDGIEKLFEDAQPKKIA